MYLEIGFEKSFLFSSAIKALGEPDTEKEETKKTRAEIELIPFVVRVLFLNCILITSLEFKFFCK